MKRFLPYLNFRNLRRLLSWGRMDLKDDLAAEDAKPSLPPVSISLERAEEAILDRFGRLAASCCRAPFALICTPGGRTVWKHTALPISLDNVRDDLLALLRESTSDDIGEVRKPAEVTGPDAPKPAEGVARYAAFAPLRDSSGDLLGALCLLDDRERSLTGDEKESLKALAAQMVARLRLEKQADQFARCQQAVESVLEFFQSHKTRGARDVFLPFLVRHLAGLAQVERVFIAEVTPERPKVARAIAVCFQGARVENFDYPLAQSPFDGVAGRHVSCHEKDVTKAFPGDEYLRGIGASGYAGISLLDSSGNLNGLIVFADRKPLAEPLILEAILVILASRVAAELENRRIEGALELSEARYKAVYEHAADGIYQMSAQDRFTAANPAMALLLGHGSASEMVQNVVSVSKDVFADAPRRAEMLSRLRTEPEVYEPECAMVRKDGRRIWVAERLRAVRDPRGELLHYEGVVRDITALKESEEACAALRSRFHALFEQAAVGAALADGKGAITHANPALERLLGFPADEIKGRAVIGLCHPDDFKAAVQAQTECIEGKRALARLELRCVRKDKATVWTALTLSATGEAGSRGLVAMWQDLSEHRQMEEALQRSQRAMEAGHARFNSVSETSVAGIAIAEPSGRISHSNSALENLLGYTKAELRARSWSDLMHGDDWKRHEAVFSECLDGARPQAQIEARFARKGGEAFPGRLSVSVAPGKPPELVGILEDLSARRRAEESLRASNQRFQAMFDGAAIGVALLDREGRVTQANLSLAHWLGVGREELVSKPLDAFGVAEDAPKIQQVYRECAEGKRDYHQAERAFTRKDGSAAWARLTLTAVRAPEGAFHYAIAMLEDITPRVLKEKALLAADAPLQKLFEQAGVAVASTDAKGRFTRTNAVLQRLLGRTPEELLSRPVAEFLHPDDRAGAAGPLGEWAEERREECRFEARFQRKDQTAVLLRVILVASGGEERAPRQGSAWFEDVTRERSSAGEARDAEAQHQALFAQSSVGVAFCDAKGRLLRTNGALAAMLGHSAEELVFRSLADFTNAADLAEFRRLQEACAEGKRSGFEVEHGYEARGGRRFWARLSVSAIPGASDQAPRMVAVLQDITVRKQVEEAFAWGETRFQSLFDGSPDSIALLDREGRVVRSNASFSTMLDFPSEDLVGRPFVELAHAEKRPEIAQFHADSLERKRDRFQVETRVMRKDHSLVWARVTLSTVKEGDPSDVHAVAIVEDISARRDAEQGLAEAREKLRQTEDKLGAAESRLQQTSQKASDTDRELDEKAEALALARDTLHTVEGRVRSLEENLHAVENRYQAVFNQPGMGVASLDGGGKITEANAALENLLGHGRGELVGKAIANLAHSDDAATFSAAQTECVEKKSDHFQVQLRLLNKHAEEVWARLIGSILHPKEGPPITLVLVEDITARVLSEELSHINHARFDAICQHTGAGVILCDEQDRITYVNPSLEQILGLSHDELLSKPIQDIAHSSDPRADQGPHAECLEGKRDHYEAEKCLRRKDQSPVWTRTTTTIVRGEDGQARYSIRVYEDMTKRRAAERDREQEELVLRALEKKLKQSEEKREEEERALRAIEARLRETEEKHGDGDVALRATEAKLSEAEEKIRQLEQRAPSSQNGGSREMPAVEDTPSPPPVSIEPEPSAPPAASTKTSEPRAFKREAHFHELIHAFITVDVEDRIVHLNPRAGELLSCTQASAFGKKIGEVFDLQRQRPVRTTSRIGDSGSAAGFGLTKSWVKRRDGNEHIFLQNDSSLLDTSGAVIGRVIVFQDFDEIDVIEQELIGANRVPSHAVFHEQLAHEFDNALAILGMISSPLLATLVPELRKGADGWNRSLDVAARQAVEIHGQYLTLSGAAAHAAAP